MSYSTRAEVRDMVKDDALNAIIGDTFIEDPAEREELVSPIIDAAIADADAARANALAQEAGGAIIYPSGEEMIASGQVDAEVCLRSATVAAVAGGQGAGCNGGGHGGLPLCRTH